MRALVICNGDRPSEELLRREVARADLVLCTDGAATWIETLGLVADLVVGDLDSLEGAQVAAPVLNAGPHDQQENSDSEKAVLVALERGAQEVVLTGAGGGRMDHALGNLALCVRYHDRARVALLDDIGEMHVLCGHEQLALWPGARLSLVALTPDVTIHTSGLEWELAEALEPGTRGLSNTATGERVGLDVRSGLVAVFIFSEAS